MKKKGKMSKIKTNALLVNLSYLILDVDSLNSGPMIKVSTQNCDELEIKFKFIFPTSHHQRVTQSFSKSVLYMATNLNLPIFSADKQSA